MNQLEIYFRNYYSEIDKNLNSVDVCQLEKIANCIARYKETGKKVIIAGNGGSASIASHLTIDLINAANIRAVNFNDPSIITCFANDYGYEKWIAKALDKYADPGDTVILISSSGESKNMLIGAKKAKSINCDVVTLSGFSADNQLRKLGRINLWVDSEKYNIVEMVHHVWLLSIVDYIIKNNKGEATI
jgi:D-sedoheptulose 7-phosphate isomerase